MVFQNPIQIIAESAHELYVKVLQSLCQANEINSVCNPLSIGSSWGRKERSTKELQSATLILKNPKNRIIQAPTFALEDAIPRTILCTLSDEIDLETIAFYNPKAIEFSDDGKTISTNYGYRIRHLNQVDQIHEMIFHLKKDPYSRRAVIHIHNTGDEKKRYAPCIDSLHFMIRDEKLHCHSFWRSENALTLLPTNLFEFTMLQELIASELNLPIGCYCHTVTSLHYYLDHQNLFEETRKVLQSTQTPQEMKAMTQSSLQQVDLLRIFERKERERINSGEEEFFQLSDYWKRFAQTIRSVIKKNQTSKSLSFDTALTEFSENSFSETIPVPTPIN